MGFLDRLSNRASKRTAQPEAPTFGDELDEHAHLVVARWGDAQREEYLGYGVPVVLACRAIDEGHLHEASAALESMLASASDPIFLYRDAGRVRSLLGDIAGAEEHLQRFLGRSTDLATPRERLEVHIELATLADARGDVTLAIEWLSASLDDEEPELDAYLSLASYLRLREFPSEALEIAETALAGAAAEPSTPLLTELGLSAAAAGSLVRAEQALATVVQRAKCSCGVRLPPEVAATLSMVYEATGRAEAAEELRRSSRSACATG